MDIIGKRNIYFAISGILVIASIIAIISFGLRSSIEFTGGSRLEFGTGSEIENEQITNIFSRHDVKIINIQNDEDGDTVVRTVPISQDTKSSIATDLEEEIGIEEKTFETVGPTIGSETRSNAIKAVIIATIAILLYIAFAFRQVSHPVSSFKFGISAIIALLHDTIITIGAFAVLGYLFGVEVDTLFITAILTVMGFSVHDTIVVFDRIRENLKKSQNIPFGTVINNAVLETLTRSLNTSVTVVIVLVSLLLFSGESIRWFLVALLIGIVVGTYSSIFTASPLLVVWQERGKNKKNTDKR